MESQSITRFIYSHIFGSKWNTKMYIQYENCMWKTNKYAGGGCKNVNFTLINILIVIFIINTRTNDRIYWFNWIVGFNFTCNLY
jgi:hypothetical protein